MNEREVANLPLNGRQVSQLYLLAPGAQTAGSGSYDNIRFSGRANQQNEIRIDGVEGTSVLDASPGNLNGEMSSGFRLQSSLESIQEFRVDSSNYPAEFGTGTGGQISVVTKSGGNALHGVPLRVSRETMPSMRAISLTTSVKSPLRLNQFGGSRERPTDQEQDVFLCRLRGSSPDRRSQSDRDRAECRCAPARRAVDRERRQRLSDRHPQHQQPRPGRGPAQHALLVSTENYGNMRLDYHFSDKYMMYIRYFRDQGISDSPIEGTSVSGSRFLVTAVPQNALINFTQMLTPTVINETKFGFNGAKTRASGFAPPIPGMINASAISVDFTGNATIPGISGQISSAGAARLGGLVRSNSTQNGRGQPYTNYTLSFIDSLSWITRQSQPEVRRRGPSLAHLHGPSGRHHVHVRQPE